jgi:hypothetical protein
LTGGYTPKYVTEGLGSGYDGPASPKGETCFVTDTGICAALRDFPAKYRFGMTLRLSEKLSGWFHGRIATPTIKTTAVGDGSTLSVEANPVRVPSLNFVSPVEEIRQEAKDAIFNGQEWGVSSGPEGVGIFIGFDDELSRNLFTWFTPNFKDKATTTNEYWTFKALGGFRNDQVQKCSIEYGELAGVVTTNSLLYKSGPPVFNKELSTLDYEVASPHYESNGEEAVGTYDLLMRSDVARCIYGFSKAPIKASLEVLASDGSTKVATTSIREEAGWITMSANGFGYSSPTLRATLTQPKEVKTRVTCIKKSMKRTFASDQKRCPKGWKTA